MGKRYVILALLALLTVVAFILNVAPAQERGGGWGPRSPEEMRQRFVDRVKESLSPTDEEWAKLEPAIVKVVGLVMEPGVAGGMRMWGRRGGAEPSEGDSEVQTAAAAVQSAVDSGAAAEEVAAKLAAYREVRDKARAELAAAREELKALVNETQEAVLVLGGILD